MEALNSEIKDPNADLREQFHHILLQYMEGAIMEEEVFNAFIARLVDAGVIEPRRA